MDLRARLLRVLASRCILVSAHDLARAMLRVTVRYARNARVVPTLGFRLGSSRTVSGQPPDGGDLTDADRAEAADPRA